MLALTFQIGPESIGLDIRKVREVVPRVRLRPVIGSPAWLPGVFVYRGRVIPVVDLHKLTGHGECPPHLSSRIILTEVNHEQRPPMLLGLLAAKVADLREVAGTTENIMESSGDRVDLGPLFADGRGVIRLLDPDRLLPTADRHLLAAAAGDAG